jgi:hypothetical protein
VVSATGVNKVYDGNAIGAVTLTDNRISGDLFTANYAAALFADKNVGTAKPISVSGITLSGPDAGNYSFNSTATAVADITAAPLLIKANDVTKVYDGLAFHNGNGIIITGFVGSDTDVVLGGSLAYSGTSQGAINAGTYSIIPTGLASPNYSITFSSGTLRITLASSVGIVSSSQNPSLPGSNVTFSVALTAVSPGNGTPAGTVRFLADGAPLAAPVSLTDGTASLTTAALVHGTHSITVEYPGDGNFVGSTNTLAPAQVVNTPPIGGTNNLITYQDIASSLSTAALIGGSTDSDGDALGITAVSPTSANGGSVSLIGSTVTYTPRTNYTGGDTFNFTVTDSFGASATGTVVVTVKSGAVTLSGSVVQPSGAFRLTGFGVPNRSYTLQASSDLVHWTDIQTSTANSEGLIEFTDSEAPGNPMRFYRTATQ